jgi:menaquinol-cytochrome c reductase iron-sulfur subunit
MALLLGVPSAVYLFKTKPKRKDSEWMDAGEINTGENDLPREITFRHNRVDGWKIHSEIETAWLSKDADGKLLAFSPWCTHLGCAYRWEAARNEFSCPCHGSRFGKEGEVLAGPASRPLDRYEIKIEGKRVWLAPAERPEAV